MPLFLLALLACRPTGIAPTVDDSDPRDSAPPGDGDTEHIPPAEGCTPDTVFSDQEIHSFGIELSSEAMATLEVNTDGILGRLTTFRRNDPTCWAELAATTRQAADTFEGMDLPALVAQYRALIADEVHADPRVAWPTSYFDHKVECLATWTATRPEAVRAWVDERDARMRGH